MRPVRLDAPPAKMDARCDQQCIVHSQGVPHGPDLSCQCTPCNAIRQQIDLWLASRERRLAAQEGADTLEHPEETPLIKVRCPPLLISNTASLTSRRCTAAQAGEALGLVLRPAPARVRLSQDGGTYSLEFQGLWCIKIAEVDRCSDSHVHIRFRRLCQVEITHTTEEEREVVHTYIGDVRQPPENDFLEQWTTPACAEDLLRSFAACEEVWLEPGDTAWAQEASGRTVLSQKARGQAVWQLGSFRFAVQIEKGDKTVSERAWRTSDLALWVKALETCYRLPSSVLDTTAWVHVPGDGFEEADLYVRRLRDDAIVPPATHLANRLMEGVAKHELVFYRSSAMLP